MPRFGNVARDALMLREIVRPGSSTVIFTGSYHGPAPPPAPGGGAFAGRGTSRTKT